LSQIALSFANFFKIQKLNFFKRNGSLAQKNNFSIGGFLPQTKYIGHFTDLLKNATKRRLKFSKILKIQKFEPNVRSKSINFL